MKFSSENLQRERHYYHERKLMYKIMDTLIHLRKMNHDLWAKKDLNDAYRLEHQNHKKP